MPLLIRDEQVVAELRCAPTPPWGVVDSWEPEVGEQDLQPGDCVLLYTDGVTEARTPDGEHFGIDRLIDWTNRSASDLVRPEKIVRGLVHSVREHQGGDLADDATVVLLRWDGSAQHASR